MRPENTPLLSSGRGFNSPHLHEPLSQELDDGPGASLLGLRCARGRSSRPEVLDPGEGHRASAGRYEEGPNADDTADNDAERRPHDDPSPVDITRRADPG